MAIVKEILRLNLGSRDRIIPGFKNMDLEQHPGVEYVGDVGDLSRFGDESVGEIFASNILEHFKHTQTAAVLKEWHRVLERGGKLYLSVPNFRRAVQIYLRTGFKDWIENLLMGDQGYDTAVHYALFDETRITELLTSAGFRVIELVDSFKFAPEKDCSNLRSNIDMLPVCINLEAVK